MTLENIVTHSIAIIVLNYNSYSDTMECIGSLQKTIPVEKVDYQIIVVDNHSTDNSFDLLQKALPESVILLQSSRNAGYAYGNNVGIKYAVEHGAEFICILNNDTICTEDFLSPCIELLNSDDRAAFVGPMLMNYKNDLVQSTGGRLSIVKGKCSGLNENVPLSSILEDIIACDVVFGAAMVFKSSIVQVIGLIPENYFLFYEETEWCCRAKRAGYVNCITTKARIIHKRSESLKNLSEMQRYLMDRNRVLFVKRNGTPGQFLCFLFFNFGRLLYRALFHRIPLMEYLKYFIDGLVERFDPRFVKIMED